MIRLSYMTKVQVLEFFPHYHTFLITWLHVIEVKPHWKKLGCGRHNGAETSADSNLTTVIKE